MIVFEIIGEFLFRILFELVFYGVFYFSGWIFLTIISLGQLRLAPLESVHDTNRGKTGWSDWSIWLYGRSFDKELKAEFVIIVGVLFWVGVGFTYYLVSK